MASRTTDFFETGSSGQFEWVLGLYDQCLRLKAEAKSSKPENVIKLDKWYQNELPKKIKARGKDAHLTHEEMVQTIKWKLARGKFRPNLVNLVQMNTPRVILQETKKAFRNLSKKEDVQAASAVLCNLKGVGPAMASAVLAAGAPHMAPFMADECLLAMPDVDSLDYTMKEYMNYVQHIKNCVSRLNAQGGDWTPHKVELAIWTHYVAKDLKPELLSNLPSAEAAPAANEKVEAAAPAADGTADTEAQDDAKPAEPAAQEEEVSNGDSASEEAEASSSPGKNGNGHGPEVTTNGNGVDKDEHEQPPTDAPVAEERPQEGVTNGSAEKQENGSTVLSDAENTEKPADRSDEFTKRALQDEDAPTAKKLRTEEPQEPQLSSCT